MGTHTVRPKVRIRSCKVKSFENHSPKLFYTHDRFNSILTAAVFSNLVFVSHISSSFTKSTDDSRKTMPNGNVKCGVLVLKNENEKKNVKEKK